jgi:opacity protein-like surface antigen
MIVGCNGKRKAWYLKVIIILMVIGFLLPAPAKANDLGTLLIHTAVPISGAAVLAAGGVLLWKNRISQPSDAKGNLGYHGPGEFYVGIFAGASFVPDMNWDNKKQTAIPYAVTAYNISTNPGPTAGFKLGYFLDCFPYLGFEGEMTFASNYQPSQTVTISPRVNGSNVGVTRGQTMIIWTTAFHFVGRYGFFKDKEVPFGRLQPYVGIGPNLGVLYFTQDSAKNFSLDIEAGIRYMITKHIGAFLEYKYFHQWDVQLGQQTLKINGYQYNVGDLGWEGKQTHFDFNNHKIVVGLSYHF